MTVARCLSATVVSLSSLFLKVSLTFSKKCSLAIKHDLDGVGKYLYSGPTCRSITSYYSNMSTFPVKVKSSANATSLLT